eukprot:g3202.t1
MTTMRATSNVTAAAATDYGAMGCSSQPEGVDDDMIGVILNYVCSASLFLLACHIAWRHGWTRSSKVGIVTELGMSIGYLTGGLVHHLYANRASDDSCASDMFYPVFCLSYLAMIASAWAWLGVVAVAQGETSSSSSSSSSSTSSTSSTRSSSSRRVATASRRVWIVRAILAVSAACILGGAGWCQAGAVTLYPGKTDPCPPSAQATCDRLMMIGEGIFYTFWMVTWWLVAVELHYARVARGSHVACAANWLAPVSLSFGPGQIMAVCVLPVLVAQAAGESLEQASERGLEIYCALRTGVTYILAVLVSHLFTFVVSGRVFSGQQHHKQQQQQHHHHHHARLQKQCEPAHGGNGLSMAGLGRDGSGAAGGGLSEDDEEAQLIH